MRLHIPSIGDKLILTRPWAFRLFHEHRNVTMIEDPGERARAKVGGRGSIAARKARWGYYPGPNDFTDWHLPKGTHMTLDRIYVRRGLAGFDSMSFIIPKTGDHGRRRFWAKLEDCNLMCLKWLS